MTSYLDLPTIFLSLAPGGTAEMSLIAIAMHTEVAAVVAHQVLRVFLIPVRVTALLAPFSHVILKLAMRRELATLRATLRPVPSAVSEQ